MFSSPSHARYRAPQRNGEVLSVPELDQAASAVTRNHHQLSVAQKTISGTPLVELRRQARDEIVAVAFDWTTDILGSGATCDRCVQSAQHLIVTGHQPQLSHAGVWAKNFGVAGLARQVSGLGLNIVVDNDTAATQAIQVPAGTIDHPRLQSVPYDDPQPVQPWEELSIANSSLFRSFATRVEQAMHPWGIAPLVTQMWPAAMATHDRSSSLVDCLSAARMSQERRWGIHNLDVPLSRLCQTRSFCMFAAHLLAQAEEFHSVYNRTVDRYRQVHRIRNNRHPVPNLDRRDGGFEMPFWYWRRGQQDRGRLFVHAFSGGTLELRSGNETLLASHETHLVDDLMQLQKRGKLRTRALTTTLFARLCLADLFVHGIGGAKYDEMTDCILAEFFEVEPPEFLVLTATLHLPIPHPATDLAEIPTLRQRLRDFEYNPDRYLPSGVAESLKQRKMELVERIGRLKRERPEDWQLSLSHHQDRNRLHHELKEVNRMLREVAAEYERETRAELISARRRSAADAVLSSREFPAALFPEGELRELVEQFRSPGGVSSQADPPLDSPSEASSVAE